MVVRLHQGKRLTLGDRDQDQRDACLAMNSRGHMALMYRPRSRRMNLGGVGRVNLMLMRMRINSSSRHPCHHSFKP